MAQRTLPNLGLTGFFDLGEDGWKDEMDLNLLRLSVLVQGGVIDKLPAEIVSPTAGDVIILDEAHPTEPNAVAVYDDGAWVYIAPNEGWLMYNQTEDYYEKFDGTVWAELATGGAGGVEEAPEDGTPYARQDAGWVAVTGGAGGSGGPASGVEGVLPDQSFGAAFIDMTGATEDRNDGFTATATGYQVPRAGWYIASFGGKWDANTGLGRQVLIRAVHSTEGNKDFRHSQPADSIHNDPWMATSGLFYLEAGDEVQYYAACNDSATFFRGMRFSLVEIQKGAVSSGGGSSEPQSAKGTSLARTTSQTIANVTQTDVVFDSPAIKDDESLFDGTSTVTIATTGWYVLSASVAWDGGDSSNVFNYAVININSQGFSRPRSLATDERQPEQSVSRIEYLTAGDTIKLTVRHTDGGNKNILDARLGVLLVETGGGSGGSGSDVELSRQYKVATPGDGFIDIPLDEFDATEFEIIAHGRPSADAAIYARLSNDNAATFLSGSADYKHRASNSDNKINLVSQTVGSGRPWIAEFRLAGMNGGAETEYFMLSGTGYDVSNSGSGGEFVIGGYPNALGAEDYNGIRIYCSAGNMDNISVTVVPKLRSVAAGSGTTGGKTRVEATDLLFESGNASEWGAPANFTVASTYEGLVAPGGQNAIYRTTGFGAGTFNRTVDLTSQFSDAELDAGSIFEMQTFLGRWSADNDTVEVRFQFLDGSDIAVGPEFYFINNDNILGDIWQPKGGRFLIPAGTRKFKVTVNVTNNTSSTANVAFSGVMAWIEKQT